MDSYGIYHKYTTAYNPRCNAICERSHFTLNEHLRCVGDDEWIGKLQAIAFAMRANNHSGLDKIPANIVFGKEMVPPFLQKYADTSVSYKRKNQKLRDLMRENKGRIEFDYSVGHLVLLKNLPKRRKCDPQMAWSF